MKYNQLKYDFGNGSFPNWTSKDTDGAGYTNGTEYHKLSIDDGWEGVSQAIMAYASEAIAYNNPSGSIGIPNGINEAAGFSQILQAIQRSNGIGPGCYVRYGKWFLPSQFKDRVLLLSGQGVLRANYPALDAASYVGNSNNTAIATTKGKFYHSQDSAGLIPDINGPYLQLPYSPPTPFVEAYNLPSAGADWLPVRSTIMPFKTNVNRYFAYINITGVPPVGTRTNYQITVPVIFENTNYNLQSLSASCNYPIAVTAKIVNALSGIIEFNHVSQNFAANRSYSCCGIVELLTIPPAASSWDQYKWGIVY